MLSKVCGVRLEEFVISPSGASISRSCMFCMAKTVAEGGVFSPKSGRGGGLADRESMMKAWPPAVGVCDPDRVGLLSGGLVKTSLMGIALLARELLL